MPFRFRLASVLRYRERKREDRRLEMLALEQAKGRIAAEIARLEESLHHYRASMEEHEGKFLSVAEIKLAADFYLALGTRLRERRAALARAEKQGAAKRAELLEANRDVKSLEQLYERRHERHRVEEARAEQKLTDEAGQRRTARKGN